METRYNVVCFECGQVWTPDVRSALWWKAKNHAEKGYLDAVNVSGVECGCKNPISEPEAPFRVFGYDDMFNEFNIPYVSLVQAPKKYLELYREGFCTVFFFDKRTEGTINQSRVQQRLEELKWA